MIVRRLRRLRISHTGAVVAPFRPLSVSPRLTRGPRRDAPPHSRSRRPRRAARDGLLRAAGTVGVRARARRGRPRRGPVERRGARAPVGRRGRRAARRRGRARASPTRSVRPARGRLLGGDDRGPGGERRPRAVVELGGREDPHPVVHGRRVRGRNRVVAPRALHAAGKTALLARGDARDGGACVCRRGVRAAFKLGGLPVGAGARASLPPRRRASPWRGPPSPSPCSRFAPLGSGVIEVRRGAPVRRGEAPVARRTSPRSRRRARGAAQPPPRGRGGRRHGERHGRGGHPSADHRGGAPLQAASRQQLRVLRRRVHGGGGTNRNSSRNIIEGRMSVPGPGPADDLLRRPRHRLIVSAVANRARARRGEPQDDLGEGEVQGGEPQPQAGARCTPSTSRRMTFDATLLAFTSPCVQGVRPTRTWLSRANRSNMCVWYHIDAPERVNGRAARDDVRAIEAQAATGSQSEQRGDDVEVRDLDVAPFLLLALVRRVPVGGDVGRERRQRAFRRGRAPRRAARRATPAPTPCGAPRGRSGCLDGAPNTAVTLLVPIPRREGLGRLPNFARRRWTRTRPAGKKDDLLGEVLIALRRLENLAGSLAAWP